MANKRDYYEVLGLSKSATKDEIKSAYRKLAKKYHPDINKEADAETKFKEIQEAYDILYDDQKRQTYDQFGHAAFEQGAGGGNPFQGGGFGGGFEDVDLGDIFSSFFGGGGRRSSPTGPQKGSDVLKRVKIDFMDSINGKKIKISHTYDEVCDHCHGSGAETPHDVKTCPTCNGRGHVNVQQQTIFGTMQSQKVCPDCGGTGKKVTKKCHSCGGSGYNRVTKDLDINIPSGISNGQQIRVTGKGERGTNGAGNGDLYIEVVVSPHKEFVRNGNDIHLQVPLNFVDAALGVTLDIPTVYGNVDLKVPAGTQPGTKLRLRGKGVKDVRGNIGDQYVEVAVSTPTNLSKEQKELLEKYQNLPTKGPSFFDRFKAKFK